MKITHTNYCPPRCKGCYPDNVHCVIKNEIMDIVNDSGMFMRKRISTILECQGCGTKYED